MVEHRTGTLLTQVQFPGAARDFSPRVNFQCKLSEGVRTHPCAIACINICAHVKVDSTKTLVSTFVLSRLDYCNSLLSGCPKHLLEKLKKVQNSAARLVLKAHKRDYVSPLLRTLHWLAIQARIEYKLSKLCRSFFFFLI